MSTYHVIDGHKDLTLHDLTTAEGLVVVSFRLWGLRYADGQDLVVPSWRTGLDAMGLKVAADQLFDPLMETILAGARQIPQVQHLGCSGISRDESNFLGCIAHYQHHQITEAEILLSGWLLPTAVRAAASLAMRFAAALEVANMLLPSRWPSVADARPASMMAGYRFTSSQLH